MTGEVPLKQSMMSFQTAPITVGVRVMVLRHGIETFQSYLFCKLLESKMLALTTDVSVLLGGVDIAPLPLVTVALIRSGELPVCAGWNVVPDHSLVEFHCAKTQFGLVVLPVLIITYRRTSPCGPMAANPDGTPVTLNNASPVFASKARAKLLVKRIAG